MQPITCIVYDGRISLMITGPEKMVSHLTVMSDLADLIRQGLEALMQDAPRNHRVLRNLKIGDNPKGWTYTYLS